MGLLRPRHVVWITTDHMRYDCIGANGNAAMHTPNLDRLAAAGVNFRRCFAQNPVCMPSRCSFMTGLYPPQTGVTDNGRDLPAGFAPTVAQVFRQAGYQTAQIGKLHFQSHEDNDLDPRARHDYGFDVLWLAEEPGCYEDAYMTWLRGSHPHLVDLFRVARPNHPDRSAAETPRVLDAPWEASFSGWIADQFMRYMSTWGGRSGSHFIHLGLYAPHPPLNPTREMFAPYEKREIPAPRWYTPQEDALPRAMRGARQAWPRERFMAYRRHFYAMVTGVDLAVGRVLEVLQRMKVLEDTLVVFCSDHGDLCGDHDQVAKNASFFDELMRLPLVFHWPRGLSARTVDGLIEMVDVLPTLLGLVGQPVPAVMGGRSLAAALRAGEPLDTRADVFAIHGPGHLMLRTARHKYVRYHGEDAASAEVLFDLETDPYERANRISDVAYREVADELRGRALHRVLEACRSTLPKTYRF